MRRFLVAVSAAVPIVSATAVRAFAHRVPPAPAADLAATIRSLVTIERTHGAQPPHRGA
jgi:hypothetical protein